MQPIARSILHFLSFLSLLAILYFICHKLDIPHGEAGAVLDEYGHQLLLDIGIAITLAVSLNLILGIAGQFSLGHAGFVAAGAYTAALISGKYFPSLLTFFTLGPLHFSTSVGFTFVMLIGSLAGMVVAAILGLLVGLPTLRLRGDYLAIATLGFGEILAVIFQNASAGGTPIFGGSTGLSLSSMRAEWAADAPNPDAPIVAAVQNYMDNTTYFVGSFGVFTLALITVYIVHNIKYATSGRALLAIREDTIASESVGVPSTRYKVAAFVIGAALAGFAGGLVAHHKSLINPESFRFMRSIEIVAMVILGGQGSITGSILAAIGLTLLPEVLRSYISPRIMSPNVIEKWRMVIYSLFIILSMLFCPQGLFGRYELADRLRWLRRIRQETTLKARRLSATFTLIGWSLILFGAARFAVEISSLIASGGAEDAFRIFNVLLSLTILFLGFLMHGIPDRRKTELPKVDQGILPARTTLDIVVENMTMQFGGLRTVDRFSLTLRPGEIVGLIGPNGAGKTTVFNLLTGVYRPTVGSILMGGRSVIGLKPHAISKLGVGRTFQNIRLFQNLSVLDNVKIAKHPHPQAGDSLRNFAAPRFLSRRSREHAQRPELSANFPIGPSCGRAGKFSLLWGPAAARNRARARNSPQHLDAR